MTCNCGRYNRNMAADFEKTRRLAKIAALAQHEIYLIILKNDGTYTFEPENGRETEGKVVEYILYM